MSSNYDDMSFEPADPIGLMKEGLSLLNQDELEGATEMLELAHRLAPDHADITLNLSAVYIMNKQYKLAIPLLEALSEQDPTNPMIWTNLGAAYLGNIAISTKAKQDRAIAAFEKALEFDPGAPNVAYNIALIYYDRRDKAQAIHWFEQAIRTDPQDRDARNYVDQLRNIA